MPEPFNDLELEQKQEINISPLTADDIEDIKAYLEFEHNVGEEFASIHDDFEHNAQIRAEQIKHNQLRVFVARRGEQLIATSVVVLENGTMGKELKSNEAWAAGTLILPPERSAGVGAQLAMEQEKVALEAKKTAINTYIHTNNFASMRLRMKIGYKIMGVKRKNPEVTYYKYKKDLTQEHVRKKDPKVERAVGRLSIVTDQIDSSSPEQILIDPLNTNLVEQALEHGYEGVSLLMPKDVPNDPEIDKNYVIFVKVEQPPENQ